MRDVGYYCISLILAVAVQGHDRPFDQVLIINLGMLAYSAVNSSFFLSGKSINVISGEPVGFK